MADAFGQAIQPWHDIYALIGSSAAALLGLLFVPPALGLSGLVGAQAASLVPGNTGTATDIAR
jgi:hypothetical protein